MSKYNVLFGILGLLIGSGITFWLTNSYNRRVLLSEIQEQKQPPINQTAAGQQNPGAAVPQVAETLEKADKEPDNFEAQIKAGEMFARISNFEKALLYFDRAHKTKPDDYQIIVLLGNVNFELKKFEEAQKWYEMALAKKPDDVIVRADLGLAFFKSEPKNVERAIKEYKTVLGINPNHEPTLQNLAVAYLEIRDDQNLKDTIAKLEKVNPNNPIIQKLKE